MATQIARRDGPLSPQDQLRYGREIVELEGRTLVALAARLETTFCQAIDLLARCPGVVLVTGIGKAGLIGQKISATLASTGTRSHFLHPAEAFHGDLGRVHAGDVLLVLSQSGETEEIVRLLPPLSQLGVRLIALTARRTSSLGRAADIVVELGSLEEVCSLGLAPSTSTTAMLAVGDALALVASRLRNFQAADFARLHPGGNLGRKLSKVEQSMRPLAQCRVSRDANTVRQVLVDCAKPGRRSGAIMLTDAEGHLTGIFTDSDLARLFERRQESALDGSIADVMTRHCTTVAVGTLLVEAVGLIAARKFSELPVVDAAGKPLGMIDLTDVAGLIPEEAPSPLAVPDEAHDHEPPVTIPFPGHRPA